MNYINTIGLGLLGNIGKLVLDYLYTRDDIAIVGAMAMTDMEGQYDPTPDIIKYKIPVVSYEEMVKLTPDYYFNISYPKIIKKDLLESSTCINLHMAKLPEYRGRNVFTHIIQNGDNIAGTTLLYMTDQIDKGDIISERQLPVSFYDTAKDLHDRVEILSATMFEEEFPKILGGQIISRSQIGEGRIYKRDLNKELDLNEDPYKIYNKIRSLDFPPYEPAYFIRDGQKVHVRMQDVEYNIVNNKIKINV